MNHIPDYMAIIQVLNNQQINVTEQINVITTEEDTIWSRHIPLVNGAKATLISYTQNRTETTLKIDEQSDVFSFQSLVPLQKGLNHIVLKYNLTTPPNDTVQVNLTGSQLEWPIERMQALVLFPNDVAFKTNKLLFGTNELDIAKAYTIHTETNGNTAYQMTGVVPPNASIKVDIELEPNQLPSLSFLLKFFQHDTAVLIMLCLGLVLTLYWIINILWETRKKFELPKLSDKTNWLSVAYQAGLPLSINLLYRLAQYQKQQGISTKNLYELLSKTTQKESLDIPFFIKFRNAIRWIGEMTCGTLILIALPLIIAYLKQIQMPFWSILTIIIISVIVLTCFYFIQKRKARVLWQNTISYYNQDKTMIGLTKDKLKYILSLMILSKTDQQWQDKLKHLNPSLYNEQMKG